MLPSSFHLEAFTPSQTPLTTPGLTFPLSSDHSYPAPLFVVCPSLEQSSSLIQVLIPRATAQPSHSRTLPHMQRGNSLTNLSKAHNLSAPSTTHTGITMSPIASSHYREGVCSAQIIISEVGAPTTMYPAMCYYVETNPLGRLVLWNVLTIENTQHHFLENPCNLQDCREVKWGRVCTLFLIKLKLKITPIKPK